MSRKYNFNAGPALLPEPVLREAQAALWDLDGSGIGLLECSHRTPLFERVLFSARDRIRRALGVGDDYDVLFLQGGARTQFYMVPMNLLRGGRATYLDTGVWAAGAAEEAQRFGRVDVPFSSKGRGYTHVPRPGEWGDLPEGTVYLHYTSNNTVAGTEYDYIPDPQGALLVCDMSSDFLSRPVDANRFDLIYAGAQKNIGPSGVTVVVVRKSLFERCDTDIPQMCQYALESKNDSMFNTPNTFGIFVIERMLAWIESQGGLVEIGRHNRAKAARLYDAIDASSLFRGKVDPGSRSLMNVTFTTTDAALDLEFAKSAEAAGFVGLKGHRIMGGLRASLYNAQTDEAVEALVAFMNEFERRKAAQGGAA